MHTQAQPLERWLGDLPQRFCRHPLNEMLLVRRRTYRIRATWKQNGQDTVQEQVVTVNAGQTATVDFTRPIAPFEAPPPNPVK
jgi:hypothetical protein